MDAFKTTPFRHQMDGLNVQRGKEAFFNASEMGTGKTWVMINEIALLWGEGALDAALVLAPKGVHSNWIVSQIPLHMPDRVRIIAREWTSGAGKGVQKKMDEVLSSTADRTLRVLAMNWDALATDAGFEYAKQFCDSAMRLMIIGDESQRIKNPSAIRTKRLMKLKPYSKYRRLCSGSAITGSPFDLFSQFGFLDETILRTTSYFAFKAEYAEMLQPGNKLLDHIVSSKNRMSRERRVALGTNVKALLSASEHNRRGVLIEMSHEIFSAYESADYETIINKCEAYKDAMAPGTGAARLEVLQCIARIQGLVGEHLRVLSRMKSNPRRLPQIVAKGKDNAPRYRNLDKLQALIKPYTFRVRKDECLDLPEKIYTQSWYEMTSRQKEAYKMMEDEARMVLADGTIQPVNKLASLMKLSQILSGYLIEPVTREINKLEMRHPKLELLQTRLADAMEDGESIIVWARFREEIRQIAELCEMEGWSHIEYHGDTDDDDRPKFVRMFESGDARIFIGQQRAGGTGITLVQASRVIYYSNTFSLEDRVQSEDRAHRIGQKRNVVYEDLLCRKTIDTSITKALRNKQHIADLINGDTDKLLAGEDIL